MLTKGLPNPVSLAPEVLIVGAGATGLTLGIALAKAGRRVLLIEGGPAAPRGDFPKSNAGPNTGLPHRGLTEGRMKALGGTTRLWGGQLVPFGPSDFRTTYRDKPEWPIDFDSIATYVGRALDFLGVPKNARNPADVWKRLGQEPIVLGPELEPTMNIWLPVADFTRLFAADIASLPNLAIATDVEANALEFGPEGRISAVRARNLDGRDVRIAAPQIVLANGTMEIVRLLLRAASASPFCPFAQNAQIGRFFIDHLHGIVGRVFAADLRKFRTAVENIYLSGRKYSLKIRASDYLMEKAGIANCAATFNETGSARQSVADLRDLWRRLFARGNERRNLAVGVLEAFRTLRILMPVIWSYVVRRRAYSLFERGILLGLEIEQIPTAESRLFLDPAEPPERAAIGIHWALDGRELDSAALFCASLADEFASRGLGTIELDPRLAARDPALLTEFHDAYHHMGGARMAKSAAEGVVDADLRVFGCPNLSVLGAAVFPSGSFANPTLTSLALALRLADRLDADLC